MFNKYLLGLLAVLFLASTSSNCFAIGVCLVKYTGSYRYFYGPQADGAELVCVANVSDESAWQGAYQKCGEAPLLSKSDSPTDPPNARCRMGQWGLLQADPWGDGPKFQNSCIAMAQVKVVDQGSEKPTIRVAFGHAGSPGEAKDLAMEACHNSNLGANTAGTTCEVKDEVICDANTPRGVPGQTAH